MDFAIKRFRQEEDDKNRFTLKVMLITEPLNWRDYEDAEEPYGHYQDLHERNHTFFFHYNLEDDSLILNPYRENVGRSIGEKEFLALKEQYIERVRRNARFVAEGLNFEESEAYRCPKCRSWKSKRRMTFMFDVIPAVGMTKKKHLFGKGERTCLSK